MPPARPSVRARSSSAISAAYSSSFSSTLTILIGSGICGGTACWRIALPCERVVTLMLIGTATSPCTLIALMRWSFRRSTCSSASVSTLTAWRPWKLSLFSVQARMSTARAVVSPICTAPRKSRTDNGLCRIRRAKTSSSDWMSEGRRAAARRRHRPSSTCGISGCICWGGAFSNSLESRSPMRTAAVSDWPGETRWLAKARMYCSPGVPCPSVHASSAPDWCVSRLMSSETVCCLSLPSSRCGPAGACSTAVKTVCTSGASSSGLRSAAPCLQTSASNSAASATTTGSLWCSNEGATAGKQRTMKPGRLEGLCSSSVKRSVTIELKMWSFGPVCQSATASGPSACSYVLGSVASACSSSSSTSSASDSTAPREISTRESVLSSSAGRNGRSDGESAPTCASTWWTARRPLTRSRSDLSAREAATMRSISWRDASLSTTPTNILASRSARPATNG
eukprot:Unigene245_Nuclearia_a/m.873 Unigene245_Nuclearia_a/g.873  ORF Unigene245_Nuclearia_a/g.873 Unigene245_Nuclearia_a/m.873 type:complete len:455 (+) Unigene245_Nuclearia_a:381-1745(+)